MPEDDRTTKALQVNLSKRQRNGHYQRLPLLSEAPATSGMRIFCNVSVDTMPFTLAPGDSLLLEVSFTTDTVGVLSASLDIDSDGGSASVVLD